MTTYETITKKLLYKLNTMKNDINFSLCEIFETNQDLTYQKDIIDLANNDISLLTSYYNNSNDDDKKKFSDLVLNIYTDKNERNEFITEFSKMNNLNKDRFINQSEYGYSNHKIIDFINKIKDNVIKSENIENKKNKNTKKLFIINKLIDYLNSKPGSIEVENISEITEDLDLLKLNTDFKNKFIYIIINNNILFYKDK